MKSLILLMAISFSVFAGIDLTVPEPVSTKQITEYSISEIKINLKDQEITIEYEKLDGVEVVGSGKILLIDTDYTDVMGKTPDITKNLKINIKKEMSEKIKDKLSLIGTVN